MVSSFRSGWSYTHAISWSLGPSRGFFPTLQQIQSAEFPVSGVVVTAPGETKPLAVREAESKWNHPQLPIRRENSQNPLKLSPSRPQHMKKPQGPGESCGFW
jgi:hypothetical protein